MPTVFFLLFMLARGFEASGETLAPPRQHPNESGTGRAYEDDRHFRAEGSFMKGVKEPWRIRLWRGIKKAPGDSCWEWHGSRSSGYGQMNINEAPFKFQRPQHCNRMVWIDTHGEIPEGQHVLHKCNNRACCRPDHLYLETNAENARDRKLAGTNKGGSLKGGANPCSKLNEKQVLEIREKIKTIPGSLLAKIYNVSHSAISAIIYRRKWKHI